MDSSQGGLSRRQFLSLAASIGASALMPKLVFGSARPKIYFTKLDQSGIFRIDDNRGNLESILSKEAIMFPAVSPDGKYLAYVDNLKMDIKDGINVYCPSSLHVMDMASGKEALLMSDRYSFFEKIVWGPDSRKLAIEICDLSEGDSGYYLRREAIDLFDFNPSSMKIIRIRKAGISSTPGGIIREGGIGGNPCFSPDGRLAYHSAYPYQSNNPTALGNIQCDILIELDKGRGFHTFGSDEANENSPTDTAFSPLWSPRGDKIIFFYKKKVDQYNHDDWRLYIMNADGTDPQLLVPDYFQRYGVNSAVWSPDGSRIAYKGHLNDEDNIFIVDIKTRERNHVHLGSVNIHPTGFYNNESIPPYLCWSPDGRFLVFRGHPRPIHHDMPQRAGNLYRVAPDGSGLSEITKDIDRIIGYR